MPLFGAGVGVERHQGVPIEPVSHAILAVKVGGRRTERRVYDPALHIEREEAPGVCARTILPRIARPGLRARFSGARNRVECPYQLARPCVPAAYVAIGAGRGRTLAVAAPRDHDISEHPWRRLQHLPSLLQTS